jgi:hypothetical protein
VGDRTETHFLPIKVLRDELDESFDGGSYEDDW